MRHNIARITLGLALASILVSAGGCFKLARESPPVERYVLGGARIESQGVAPTNGEGLSVGIRRLDLAPYLATLAIIVRRADNEIITTGFHRWAESPRSGLNRAVSGYLALSPGIRSVDVAPWPVRSQHDYLIQLHVGRLEGVSVGSGRSGEAHLSARWEIIRAHDDALVARGVTEHRTSDWTVNNYAALVAQLDQGLVVLAGELVACLSQLGPAKVPAPVAPITMAAVPAESTTVTVEREPVLECVAR